MTFGNWEQLATQKLSSPAAEIILSGSKNPDSQDDYSSATPWTQTGSTIVVTGGQVVVTNANSGTNDRITKPLGVKVDDKRFLLDFEASMTDSSSSSNFNVIGLSAGTQSLDNGTIDQDDIRLQSGWIGGPILFLTVKEGISRTSYTSGGNQFVYTNGVLYYIRLIRLSKTQIRFQVFTDAARTVNVHDVTITITDNPTGLTHVQHGTNPDTSAGRLFNMTGDNYRLYNDTFITEGFSKRKLLYCEMIALGDAAGVIKQELNYDDDANTVYNMRQQVSNATGTTGGAGETKTDLVKNDTIQAVSNFLALNISDSEKMGYSHGSRTGNSNLPSAAIDRNENFHKYIGLQQATKVKISTPANNYQAETEATIYGTDLPDATNQANSLAELQGDTV